MMKPCKLLNILVLFLLAHGVACAQQQVMHSRIGDSVVVANRLKIKLIAKHQNYDAEEKTTLDADINSPKSVRIFPDGSKYYINSLEGFSTVVYDAKTNNKLKVITHKFGDDERSLWGEQSPYFKFTHFKGDPFVFGGKPVESTLVHDGRYLLVTYYRRSFDINAQDPSAIAVIDTRTDEVVRLMNTGPLPKMIATSHDDRIVAVTHWGDNTVALLDVSSNDPFQWKFTSLIPVEHQLILNYSNSVSVDRDNDDGLLLRGTLFTPDDRYLLVSCMSSKGGIAVIDVQKHKYLGMLRGMRTNIRHLVINNGYLYLSINIAGYVQRIKLSEILRTIEHMRGDRIIKGWETVKVDAGARTISLSPDGRYLFAACSYGSKLVVVDTKVMKVVARLTVDSYPVGLDISADGKLLIVTSQGHKEQGGNSVEVFSVSYDGETEAAVAPAVSSIDKMTNYKFYLMASIAIVVMLIFFAVCRRRMKMVL